jgi:sigma-B regulation protein RsbU (phosphoserine phosphatase)
MAPYVHIPFTSHDLKARLLTMSNSGLPYPIHCSSDHCGQIVLPGVPLGSFPGVSYDEVTLPLRTNDVFVFCSDGILEAANEEGVEFGGRRLCEIVQEHRDRSARAIVDAIFEAVTSFQRPGPHADDMTAVAVRITA